MIHSFTFRADCWKVSDLLDCSTIGDVNACALNGAQAIAKFFFTRNVLEMFIFFSSLISCFSFLNYCFNDTSLEWQTNYLHKIYCKIYSNKLFWEMIFSRSNKSHYDESAIYIRYLFYQLLEREVWDIQFNSRHRNL